MRSVSPCLFTRVILFPRLKFLFVPVKCIDICSDILSIENRIAVDHTCWNEERVVELLYCPHHERLYDATEHQWIPFVRGDVRLVLTIYPRRGDLHVRHNICDVCIRVSLRCWGQQLALSLVRVPARPSNPAVPEYER